MPPLLESPVASALKPRGREPTLAQSDLWTSPDESSPSTRYGIAAPDRGEGLLMEDDLVISTDADGECSESARSP